MLFIKLVETCELYDYKDYERIDKNWNEFFFFQRIVQSQLFDSITENFSSGIDDEQKLLEQRLLEQQRQSEEDSRWLAREEVRY